MGKKLGAAAMDLGMQAAGGLVGTGLGLLLEGHNDRRQIRQQQKLTDMEIEASRNLTQFGFDKQYEMWKKTNYSAQMEELKQAGLNPGLMYGMGGGGGTTTGGASGHAGGGNAPVGGGEVLATQGMAMQLALLKAQKENIEADTANKLGDAANKPLTGKNIEADTTNKILQQVIHEYTGKEMKSTFENVKEPNRSIEADTYQTELEARKGVAGTLYELWTENKLHDKGVAEIENILLQGAKTREEIRQIYKQMELLEENIKGAKLDNVIRDLETRLQTETGIDRNSPAWLKVLGRLFIQLMGK